MSKTIVAFFKGLRILILVTVLAATFTASPALAEDEGYVITIERLKGIGVGVKIVFPGLINEDLIVVLNGKVMSCSPVVPKDEPPDTPTDTLYCTENLRPKEAGVLTILGEDGQAASLRTVLASPPMKELDPEPAPPDPDPKPVPR